MADHSSAAVFQIIFQALAEGPRINRKAIADRLWEKSADFDFAPYQMKCDDALLKLGLAENCEHCGIRYRGDDHSDCEYVQREDQNRGS